MNPNLNQQIISLIPAGFSQEAQEIIAAMTIETYSEAIDLSRQVEDAVERFEAEYPPLSVCPRCDGGGCSYCDFDGVYNPDEKEPDGTN
ncbi:MULTISPECIES: hypothetical protein [unclassified Microcoleus]|uniref:hypothetical protein n=1 Tax=unclassified Microcoleus TaxID=2642155 RepID=UPI002FD6AACC